MFTGENGSERLEKFGTELGYMEDENDCVPDWDNWVENIRYEAPGAEEYPSASENFPGLKRGYDLPIKIHWAEEAFQDQKPIDWIVENWFSAGSVSVLYGDPDSNKTYAMIDCAVCLAFGKPWLSFQTKQSTVLIIEKECGQRRLEEWNRITLLKAWIRILRGILKEAVQPIEKALPSAGIVGNANNRANPQIRTANSENFTEDAELAVVATASEPSRSLVYQRLTAIKTRCSEKDWQLEVEVDDGQ